MLIGIDASKVAKTYQSGTEVYSTEIIRAFSRIDRENQYLLYTPKPIRDKLPNLGKNFKVKILPFRKFWTQIRLSQEMLAAKPDIFFFSPPPPSRFSSQKNQLPPPTPSGSNPPRTFTRRWTFFTITGPP